MLCIELQLTELKQYKFHFIENIFEKFLELNLLFWNFPF